MRADPLLFSNRSICALFARTAARPVAVAIAFALFASACTTSRTRDATQDRPATQHGWTSEDLPIAAARDGSVDMVLTNEPWPDFEQARAHPVEQIDDGDPIYVHVRAKDTIAAIAIPPSADKRYAFSDWPHLRLEIRPQRRTANSGICYLTLTPQDLKAHELVVALAPAAMRPGGNPTDCLLVAMQAGATGPGSLSPQLELRLIGHAGRGNAWLPRADLLSLRRLGITAAVPAPRYRAMLSELQHETRQEMQHGVLRKSRQKPSLTFGQTATLPEGQHGDPYLRPPIAGSALVALGALTLAPTTAAPGPASLPSREATTDRGDNPPTGNTRIVIHYPVNDPAAQTRARGLAARLLKTGSAEVEMRAVPLMVSIDNIRLFREQDRTHALEIRESLGTDITAIRDFSNYRPLPRPGTIEVWLSTDGKSASATTPATESALAYAVPLSSAAVLSRR